jgi:hypothetical protein
MSHEDFAKIPLSKSRFPCNRPDRLLIPSGRSLVSRRFSMLQCIRPDDQPTPSGRHSEFEKKLDFLVRHESGIVTVRTAFRYVWTIICVENFLTVPANFRPDALQFPRRFCTCLNNFIITLCSSIGLRQNWCFWKANKK